MTPALTSSIDWRHSHPPAPRHPLPYPQFVIHLSFIKVTFEPQDLVWWTQVSQSGQGISVFLSGPSCPYQLTNNITVSPLSAYGLLCFPFSLIFTDFLLSVFTLCPGMFLPFLITFKSTFPPTVIYLWVPLLLWQRILMGLTNSILWKALANRSCRTGDSDWGGSMVEQ